ncbi:site-specific integrase [Pirellulaceae bacterium]|nr:site-specific integrase [Pirellulaceae bacterium]
MLILALARFGGLRVPSEVHELTWDDINFDEKKIMVRSPKTEHHEGKESRVMPMFPEIEQAINELREQPSTEGKTFVINQHRGDNLRTRFLKIIKRAGVKEWPKQFQNLRSTRETELANTYPIHVVCRWLGNSPSVAMKHYLQMTDEHFEKALENPTRKAAQSTTELGVNG